jgi:hypothetical protein
MAWEYGFFNSVKGDRPYNAQQMSSIFEGLITNGVYESVGNKMAVQPSSGMTIQIATGRGWFAQHWVNNDTPYLITLEASDVTLNRYAAICIKVDESDAVRSAVPYVKYSAYATNPTKPTMTRTETLKEYCLAYVYIKAGSGEIKAADIEDTRPNRELCGWVTGLIEQLNSTTLWSQWEALFKDWFSGLQDLLNENTEAMLVGALPVSLTLTIPVDQWVSGSGGYTASMTVTGMTNTKSVLVSPATESVTAYSASEVKCSGQSTNTLEFTAVTQPTEVINVDVLHLGV